MVKVAIFPGQGSQAVGMGRELFEQSHEARAVFEEVDEALGEKLSTLIFEGPADALTLTANTQPALMATSLAALRALEARAGRKLAELVTHVAGHSLGEYSALAAVGALGIGDAARLLRIRGSAMQEAVAVGEGAMAAVLGLPIDAVEALAADGIELSRAQIRLEQPIKTTGIHDVTVELHPEVEVHVQVNVARSREEADIQAGLAPDVEPEREEEVKDDDAPDPRLANFDLLDDD